MNMPPAPKPRAYAKHNKVLLKVTKAVSDATLSEALEEIYLKGDICAEFTNCAGVSCDGTHQKRGCS